MSIPDHLSLQFQDELDNMSYTHANHGYVMLLAVLILLSLTTTVGILFIQVGTDVGTTSLADGFRVQAEAMAEGCAQEALQQIKDSTPFAGYGDLTVGTYTCSYEVIDNGGQDRVVRASSTIETATKRVLVTIDKINPQINVVNYGFVSSF